VCVAGGAVYKRGPWGGENWTFQGMTGGKQNDNVQIMRFWKQ
jgi:hypothetical protein